MRATPISELYKDHVGKLLSELPDDLVNRSRILRLHPKTQVEADYVEDRINIILGKEDKVIYIIGG